MTTASTPTKHDSITQLLTTRINQGMYLQGTLPGERALASELGVGYLTLRKATKQLLDDGMLVRMNNGRLAPNPNEPGEKTGPQIGILVSMFPGRTMSEWVGELNRAVSAVNGSLRMISYTHESDPRIFEALDADLDGLFIVYRFEPSLLLKNQLLKHKNRLVSLWFDLTHLGIPSVENAPPQFVSKAIDHLKKLGHKRVDFLSTTTRDTVLRDRIHYWQQALEHYQLDGELFEKTDYFLGSSGLNARQMALDMDNQGQLENTTAVICGTTEMATGFQRGCHEVGLTVGRDISVVGFGEMHIAQLCVPSITTIQPGPRRPLLDQAMQWIMRDGKEWNRPLSINSLDVDLFKGESTGPPCDRSNP